MNYVLLGWTLTANSSTTLSLRTTSCCVVSNLVVDNIYNRFSHLLTDLNQPWLYRENLKSLSIAVHNKGAALDNCWGFVDGTVRPICKPKHEQGAVCNGHKRAHAMKFQSVVAATSMIPNLFGLLRVEGVTAGC